MARFRVGPLAHDDVVDDVEEERVEQDGRDDHDQHELQLGVGPGWIQRLVTGDCVIRETTQTGCPWSRPRVSLSIYYLDLLFFISLSP